MIPDNERLALEALIQRLEETPVLSELDRFYKERPRKKRCPPGEDWDRFHAQLKKDIERTASTAAHPQRDKNHPVYGDTNYALGFHVNHLKAHLDDWFAWAHYPSASMSKRIPIILKRAKEVELRDRFIAAYDKHFRDYWKPNLHREPSGDKLQDVLQMSIERLNVNVKEVTDDSQGNVTYSFEFHCCDCGGYILEMPEDNNPDGPVVCKACRQVFGIRRDLERFCKHIGDKKLIELGYG